MSEQYTPEVIFEMYYPTIMDELSEESELEASLFHKAPKEFLSKNKLHIEIPENFVAARKMRHASDAVVEIYKERFDICLEIEIEQLEKKESRYSKDADEALRQEVQKIVHTYEETKKAAKEELKQEKEEAQQRRNLSVKKRHTSKRKLTIRIFSTAEALRAMRHRFAILSMRLARSLSADRFSLWIPVKYETKRRLSYLM